MAKLCLVVYDPSCSAVSSVKTPGQLLSANTFAEILSHLCHVPFTQTPVVSSHWLLIAQGLSFGNYVVKCKSSECK